MPKIDIGLNSEIYNNLLKSLSNVLGLTLDQTNFWVLQTFGILFGIFFRKHLSHRKVSVVVRHYTSLIVGLFMGYLLIGLELYHLLVLTTLSYLSILICSPTIVQKVVLVIGLGYLSYFHIMRLIQDNQDLVIDITCPLMVAVQRVTNVAFSLNDGLTKTENELTEEQNRYAIRKRPTLLEFFSYLFQFPTLICGPLVFYNDYIEFINGHNFEKHLNSENSELPSPKVAIIKKLLVCILLVILHFKITPYFPIDYLKDKQFLYESTLFSRIVYVWCLITSSRLKYYHIFLLNELVCNASGLGFQGFSSDGRPIWDGMSNVDIIEFEGALSLRKAFESWNKTTQIWFRRIAYDRHRRHKLFWTYLLSSIWHGFYPGYYITFFTFAFITIGARNVRRTVRYRFISGGRALTLVYDCLTFLSTQLFISYMVFPFSLLEFWASIQVYKQLYFFGHILGLIAIFILPKVFPSLKSYKEVSKHLD